MVQDDSLHHAAQAAETVGLQVALGADERRSGIDDNQISELQTNMVFRSTEDIDTSPLPHVMVPMLDIEQGLQEVLPDDTDVNMDCEIHESADSISEFHVPFQVNDV